VKTKILFCILVVSLLALPSCVNHGNCCPGPTPTPNPTPTTPPTPISTGNGNGDLCWNQVPDTTKWVRVNSSQGSLPGGCPANPNDAGLNIYTWHYFVNDPVGTTLNVCADATLPSNWQQPIPAFYDATGCDAAAHTASDNNERQYVRMS
jgi:hypothetical protein